MRLCIQRDGKVIVREHGEPDRELEKNDTLALVGILRAIVELEIGLTSAQLFRALMPWAAFLSRAAWIDYEAWLASMTRVPLHVVTGEPVDQSDDEPPLDAVVVHPVLSLHRAGRSKNSPITSSIHWRTSGRYASPRPNGFGGEDRFCSLSLAAPQSWAHVPLVIDPVLLVDDYVLLRDGLPAIGDAKQAPLLAEPAFFDAIILGFLDDISFRGAPSELEQVGSELVEQVAAIKEGRANVKSFESTRDLMVEIQAVARDEIPAASALPRAEEPST